MSVVIRLARAGTKKRPVYHVVVADSRFPRDGRFIERLGHFNPLLPRDSDARLKLDMDKVKAWLAKGAQPSDRVSRFLDAAGVVKRAARNQYLAMVGGVLLNGLMLALLVIVFTQAVGVNWIGSVGFLSSTNPSLLNLPGNLSPSFNFIVSLLTGNVLIPLIIGIGFIFWALMGTPLSELQATRYMLAWAVDRMIPSPLGDVNERFHSPVKAIIFCTVTGTLALIALVTIPQASLLGALLAQILAFILVSIAGIVFPYRLRHVWEAGGGHRILGIPSVTLAGIGGVLVLGSLMLLFIFNSTINSAFGVTARLSLSFMIGVIVVGILWYIGAYFLNRNQGIDLGLTYSEIPPE